MVVQQITKEVTTTTGTLILWEAQAEQGLPGRQTMCVPGWVKLKPDAALRGADQGKGWQVNEALLTHQCAGPYFPARGRCCFPWAVGETELLGRI